MQLADYELQIAAQLGGPGCETEVRTAWVSTHTGNKCSNTRDITNNTDFGDENGGRMFLRKPLLTVPLVRFCISSDKGKTVFCHQLKSLDAVATSLRILLMLMCV